MSDTKQIHNGRGDNVSGDKYVIFTDSEYPAALSIDQFLSHCLKEYSVLPMLGISRELNIQDIFVTLTVSSENPSGEKLNIDTCGFSVDAPVEELNLNRDLGSPYRLSTNRAVPLHSLLQYNKTVVLGEPGAGKTTLQKHLLINICKGTMCRSYIPVFVKLADIKVFSSGCIQKYIKDKYPFFYSLICHQIFENGKAVLFLDGFDEVMPENQNIISSDIANLSAMGNKICISCRTAVFPRNVLPSDFHIFECTGFNIAQRRKFINNWFSYDAEMASRVQMEISKNPNTFSLSRNPLLLSLMVLQFEESPDFSLPKKRIEIYIGAIKTLIKKREIRTETAMTIADKLSLLEKIASGMSFNKVESITAQQLSTVFTQWKSENSYDNIPNSELSSWIKQSGILCEQIPESGVFYFLHLTLQEALTATYVIHNLDALSFIQSNYLIPRLEETVRLVISLLSEKQTEKASAFFSGCSSSFTDIANYYVYIGRFISDYSYQFGSFYGGTFKTLMRYVTFPPDSIERSDLIIAISSMCNAEEKYTIYMINTLRDQISTYYALGTYIDILKLSPSEASFEELKYLLEHYSSMRFRDIDLQTEIIGIIINALEFTNDGRFCEHLYDTYIHNNGFYLKSHLSAITAETLGKIQSPEIKEKLNRKFPHLNLLDVAILCKYEDEELNKKIYSSLVISGDRFASCLINQIPELSISFSQDELEYLMAQCKGKPEIFAYILSNHSLFFGNNTIWINQKLLEDDSYPLIVRCAALQNYIFSTKDDEKELKWISNFITQQNKDEFLIIAINSFSFIASNKFIKSILNHIKKPSTSDVVIESLIRYMTINNLGNLEITKWLFSLLEKCPSNSDIYLRILLALAYNHFPEIYNMISSCYSHNSTNYQIIAICKALTYLRTEEATDKLLTILDEQNDISVISSIINMVGSLEFTSVEEKLISYLKPENWPQNWPAPLPALRKGEQRPTDLRLLNIVLALNRSKSPHCLQALTSIAYDKNESDSLRRAARIAIKNLLWKN